MSVPKHWLQDRWYPRRLTVHQQRYRHSDSIESITGLAYWLGSSDLFNRTNILHTSTFCVTKIKYNMNNFLKIIACFIIMLLAHLHVRVGKLLSRGKYFHDRIISLRGEVWAHKNPSLKCMYQAMKVNGRSFVCC